jgi:hypothetical protein
LIAVDIILQVLLHAPQDLAVRIAPNGHAIHVHRSDDAGSPRCAVSEHLSAGFACKRCQRWHIHVVAPTMWTLMPLENLQGHLKVHKRRFVRVVALMLFANLI